MRRRFPDTGAAVVELPGTIVFDVRLRFESRWLIDNENNCTHRKRLDY